MNSGSLDVFLCNQKKKALIPNLQIGDTSVIRRNHHTNICNIAFIILANFHYIFRCQKTKSVQIFKQPLHDTNTWHLSMQETIQGFR